MVFIKQLSLIQIKKEPTKQDKAEQDKATHRLKVYRV